MGQINIRGHSQEARGHGRQQPATPPPHAHPLVELTPVDQPVVVDDKHGRDPQPADALDQRQRHASHRPPRDDVRPQLFEVLLELAGVVELISQPLRRAQVWELIAIEVPIPAQGAMDIRIGLGDVGRNPVIRGQDPHLVTQVTRSPNGRLPHHLVSPDVVGRIHIAHSQDAQGSALVGPRGLARRGERTGGHHITPYRTSDRQPTLPATRPVSVTASTAGAPNTYAAASRGSHCPE